MLDRESTISEKDLDLMPTTDDPEEVVKYINNYYAEKVRELGPNYEL